MESNMELMFCDKVRKVLYGFMNEINNEETAVRMSTKIQELIDTGENEYFKCDISGYGSELIVTPKNLFTALFLYLGVIMPDPEAHFYDIDNIRYTFVFGVGGTPVLKKSPLNLNNLHN